MRKFLKNLSPSDAVNLSFVSLLLLLSIVFPGRIQVWYLLVPLYISMLITAIWLIYPRHGTTRPGFQLIRRWYPLLFVPISFFSLREIVHHILPYDIDAQLIKLDRAIFGVDPTVFISGHLGPYLTDLLELCYASFYLFPVILAFSVYVRGKMREFETVATAVCLGFYLSYIGNMLFPVQGPHYTLEALNTAPIKGKLIGDFIRSFLFTIEPYKWDCFPSGHTAVTLICVIYFFRYSRRLFRIMLPVAVGLIFSTVSLRHHYVVDLVAGGALGGIVVIATDFIQCSWPDRTETAGSNGRPKVVDSGM
jgi:membrane-associated phospholipid phosphatase